MSEKRPWVHIGAAKIVFGRDHDGEPWLSKDLDVVVVLPNHEAYTQDPVHMVVRDDGETIMSAGLDADETRELGLALLRAADEVLGEGYREQLMRELDARLNPWGDQGELLPALCQQGQKVWIIQAGCEIEEPGIVEPCDCETGTFGVQVELGDFVSCADLAEGAFVRRRWTPALPTMATDMLPACICGKCTVYRAPEMHCAGVRMAVNLATEGKG